MKLLHVLALIVAFFLGVLVDATWRAGRSGVDAGAQAVGPVPRMAQDDAGNSTESRAPHASNPAGQSTGKGYRLDAQTVEALLAGGGPQRMLMRMGFNERELKAIEATKTKGIAALKELEKSHAKVVRDEKGEHVEIAAFQDERDRWMEGLETDLGSAVGQDRASIVARMIAFSDNDEDVGKYRRELYVSPPQADGGKVRIEEKSFDSEGRHLDSDYEVVDSGSKSRWGHLLDFDGE